MRDALLNRIATVTWRWPWWIIISAMLLAVLSGFHAWHNLRLDADTDNLISPSRPFMRDYRRFLDEFGDLEYIYIAVQNPGDESRAQAVIDALTNRLRHTRGIPAVHCGVTVEDQTRIATRAMTDDELKDLAIASRGFKPFVERQPAAQVVRHAQSLLNQLVQAGAVRNDQPREELERLGGGAIFALKAVAAALEDSASAREMQFLEAARWKHQYFAAPSRNLFFVAVVPVKDYQTLAIIQEPLRLIRQAMDEVRTQFPDVEIGLTGKAVLQADEMATTATDMTRASMIAFAIVAVLFMLVLRSVFKPVLATIAFGCAVGWTYGFATLAVGHLNLLSIVFALVLVGIGFDYGVHVIARFNEYRSQLDLQSALRQAIIHSGRANITSAGTSAAVFLLALVTQFRGLQELGLIAGAGLLLCLAAMVTVLPALLAIAYRSRSASQIVIQGQPSELTPGVLKPVLAAPGTILIVIVLGTLVLLFLGARVRFEDNLLELQAEGLESVEWERRIIQDSPSMTWFGAVIADTQQQVLETIARARRYPTIGQVRSVMDVIQPDSHQRDQWRAQLHQHGAVANPPMDEGAEFLQPTQLEAAAQSVDVLAIGAAAQSPQEAAGLRQLATDLRSLAQQLQHDTQEAVALRQKLESHIASISATLRAMLAGDRLSLRDALPDGLRNQYMSESGRYLVMLHPSLNVWDYEPMRQFVEDLRQVDPNVTGPPIATFESMRDMRNAFLTMAALAFVVVAVLVWLDFRSVRLTLLAMGPLVIGLLWLTEYMGLVGISFNLANFFSVSILLGVTVDSSVHILHRYKEGGPTRLHLGSTRRAVILTSLTTMIGFGCLMLAHHRGLRSLGQVMAIGSTACLLACLVVLPAFLAWRERRRAKQG